MRPARSLPRVTQRLVLPFPWWISTTRMVLRAVSASVAERSRPAALSFFSRARCSRKARRGDEDVGLRAGVGLVIDGPHVDDVLEVPEAALDLAELLVEGQDVDR